MPKPTYPIPEAGTQDWKGLIAMFRGMQAQSQLRANEIRAPLDDPEEEVRRARAQATADAYAFAAQMIDIQYYPRPT